MWYDQFDIADLIPDNATLTGADGEAMQVPSAPVKITLEKGGSTTKSFELATGEPADELLPAPRRRYFHMSQTPQTAPLPLPWTKRLE